MNAGPGDIAFIIVIVAVVVRKKNSDEPSDSPSTSSLHDLDRDSIPEEYRGTELDPWTWTDTFGFNLIFTAETAGGLLIMGLYTDWYDCKTANDRVHMDKPWKSYGSRPAWGVNVGGWLFLEPFITPTLFEYASDVGIIGEWILCSDLRSSARDKLEEYYARFITESTFADIAAASLGHWRTPFSYWAVAMYHGDSYVKSTFRR